MEMQKSNIVRARHASPLPIGLLILLAWLPLLLAITTTTIDGMRITPTQGTTMQGICKTVAILSACQGAPGVTARDYASLDDLPDANCTILAVDPRNNYGQFTFEIDADANTATVQAWVAPFRYDPGTGTDRDILPRFTLAWQWAITGGTQTGPNTNVYCDTVTATEYWPAPGMVSDSGNNRICRYDVDLRGVAYIAFLRTDADANLTARVDLRGY